MPNPGNVSDELHDGILTHAVSLLRVAAGERAKVLAMLEALEAKLIADLSTTVGKTPNAISRLQALLKQTQQTISGAYADIAASGGKALSKIAQLEATKTVNVVNAALKVSVATVAQTPAQLAAIAGKSLIQGKFPKEWWDAQSKQLQDKFATAMREGMLKGEGVDELTRRVRGTKAKAYTDGIMVASKAQAEALVRTSVQTTANEARIATILGNPRINKAIQWVATLDSRTTVICKALDGLRWTVPDLKPIDHDKEFPGPTAHWNCRSTQVPVTFSWKELAGPKNTLKTTGGQEGNYGDLLKQSLVDKGMTPEAAAQTVQEQAAKMAPEPNGASGTVTFEDWLKGKTDAEVNALLGPGRAQLWRDGKVTVADMTDQTNRPLSIAELEKMVAANSATPAPKEGENGLSLADRKLLQDSMVHGAQFQEVLTHYVDSETGIAVKATGTTLTPDQLQQVQGFKALHVLQNSLAAGEVWGGQQFQLFGALPNFQKASLVGPTGRVVSVQVKAGKVFDQPAAAAVLAKFDALKNTKTIPQTQQKFRSAVSDQGALKMTIGTADAVTLPPKTYNKAYPTPVKPAPFYDPEAEAATTAAAAQAKLEADAAAKAQAERQAWEATKKAADAQQAIEAQKAADAAEAMQARQAAAEAIAAAEKAEAEAQKQAEAQKAKNDAAQAEIAAVIADPTGKKLLLKNIGLLLKAEPGLEPAELLAKAKVQAIADQAKASTAAALSGYKQKVLEGKEPTPAQKKALDTLEPEAKNKFLDSVANALEAQKAATAQKAAAEAAASAQQQATAAKAVAESKPAQAPLVPTGIPEPEGFPPDPNNLKVLKPLGGTTGAELVQDAEGNQYVRKRGASAAHLREEVVADALYRAAGLDVPEAKMYETPTGPVKLARFVEGKTLADYLRGATAAQREAIATELRKGFPIDALMGNWDVLGTSNDNVLVGKAGRVWRIDNGGSLRFRAQGTPKVGDQWNEYPTELWTMRGKQYVKNDTATLPGNVQVFGPLSIFDAARQAAEIDRNFLAVAPADLRPTLERRLENMQAIARKALEYERDGLKWKADSVDEITRHMMALREGGLVDALPKAFTTTGTTVTDENGVPFDHLRTKGQGGMASAPAATLAPGDVYWPQVKAALATYGHNVSNGNPLNLVTYEAAMAKLPELKQKAAAGDAMAKHYAGALETLQTNWEKFKAGKGYTAIAIVEPYKAPAADVVATPKPATRTQSLISDLAKYITSQGGDINAAAAWQGAQAGSSWSPEAKAFKWWHARNQNAPVGSMYWGSGKEAAAKAAWETLAKRFGGEAVLEKTFRAYAAFVQETLGNTAFKFNDPERRLVRLIRTEDSDVLRMNKHKVGDYGTVTLQRGSNESHSIYRRVGVHGTETTVQAVPHTRITGLYWFERTPGAGNGSFLGDSENEFTANTNGLPAAYVPSNDALKVAAGGDNDASKWGVPL